MKKIAILITAASVIAIFAGMYSLLSSQSFFGGEPLFNSPDETANYFFSKHYAQTGKLSFQEPLAKPSRGFVHPRSMTVRGDQIVPVGFLGLPVLYGGLARIFGVNAIPFFTPILASITALFFYLLIVQFFPKKTALISSALFLIHPAYLYNAQRAMLPNVLFVDLLIIGVSMTAVLLHSTPRRVVYRSLLAFGSGAIIGGALWVRFSEVFWVAPLVIFAALFMMRKRLWWCFILYAAGIGSLFGAQCYFNAIVYGNPLLFGYQTALIPNTVAHIEQVRTVAASFLTGNFADVLAYVQSLGAVFGALLFPFGVSLENALRVSRVYLVGFFPLFSILAAVGFAGSFHARPRQWLYTFIVVSLSLWLIIFYGSWEFYDNINHETTIGTSYVRYWLPIYLLTLPWAAQAIGALFQYSKQIGRIAALCIIVSLLALSFQQSITAQIEGVEAMISELREYAAKRTLIREQTPVDALIVSARSDKIFFPARRVAEHIEDFRELELIAPLTQSIPVYYYGFWREQDADYLSQTLFKRYGLALEVAAQTDEREWLYRVIASP